MCKAGRGGGGAWPETSTTEASRCSLGYAPTVADSVKYRLYRLDMVSPWNFPGATTHEWSVKFSVSGNGPQPAGEQEATALDLWYPISRTTLPGTYLAGWSYYDPGAKVASGGATYTSAQHVGDGGAYTSTTLIQQLEVCLVARCPVGKSSRGKTVYLRKWIHNTVCATGDPNSHNPIVNATSILSKWATGCGPSLLVPVSPTTGVQGGPWTFEQHLFTHQLRKGPKARKPPAASTNSIEIPPIAA